MVVAGQNVTTPSSPPTSRAASWARWGRWPTSKTGSVDDARRRRACCGSASGPRPSTARTPARGWRAAARSSAVSRARTRPECHISHTTTPRSTRRRATASTLRRPPGVSGRSASTGPPAASPCRTRQQERGAITVRSPGELHPFKAPAVSPRIRWRWRKVKRTVTGTVERMTPAESWPYWISYWPTMNRSPVDRVRISVCVVKVMAKRSSLHEGDPSRVLPSSLACWRGGECCHGLRERNGATEPRSMRPPPARTSAPH